MNPTSTPNQPSLPPLPVPVPAPAHEADHRAPLSLALIPRVAALVVLPLPLGTALALRGAALVAPALRPLVAAAAALGAFVAPPALLRPLVAPLRALRRLLLLGRPFLLLPHTTGRRQGGDTCVEVRGAHAAKVFVYRECVSFTCPAGVTFP